MKDKKIIIILGATVLLLAAALLYSLWINFALQNDMGTSAVSVTQISGGVDPDKKTSDELGNLYADEYGFEFTYPTYMDLKVVATEIPPTDLEYIDLNMRTLSGLGPIVKLKITDSRNRMFLKNIKNSESEVWFGNIKATRIDWGVAGGEFVTFELPLKNKRYLYIEADKHIVDRKFGDEFQEGQLNELEKASNGFWQIQDSFAVYMR